MKRRIMLVSIFIGLLSITTFISGFGLKEGLSATEVTIGLIMPITGPAAQNGQDQRDGFLLGVDYINEKLAGKIKIKTVIDDSQAKNDLAAQYATKQIQIYKVPLIVGAYTGPTMAMAPIAESNKVVLLNNGAQGDILAGLSPYLFNTIPSYRLNAETMADFLQKDKKLKRLSVLFENTVAGKDQLKYLVARWKSNGGEILSEDIYEPTATDFRSQIAKVKSLNPDVIISAGTMAAASVQLHKQLKEARVTQTIALTSGSPNDQFAKGMDNPNYEVIMKADIDAAVARKYKEKFNKNMEIYAAHNYNAAMILEQVLKSLIEKGKEITGANIRQAIYDIGTFNVVGGKITFDKKTNTAKSDRAIYDTTNGKQELVKIYKGEE